MRFLQNPATKGNVWRKEKENADVIDKNGRVVHPVTGIDQMLDLVIEDQKIVKLLKPDETVLYEKENKPQVEDATGCVIAPGLTDVHVHFQDWLRIKKILFPELGCACRRYHNRSFDGKHQTRGR